MVEVLFEVAIIEVVLNFINSNGSSKQTGLDRFDRSARAVPMELFI